VHYCLKKLYFYPKKMKPVHLFMAFAGLSILSCDDPMETQKIFLPDNSKIHYTGRIDFSDTLKPKLSSAGAYFYFTMRGTSCTLLLDNEFEEPGHSYISVAVDGHYQKRIKVSKEIKRYVIAENLTYAVHNITVCKATESFLGYIELQGIQCRSLLKTKIIPKRKIEFIGNSITSGAELDTTEFPCDSGQWHDRHNAYLAYGPIVARSLKAQWVLSSISGMGLTRNWNNEGPAVPAFYDNLYLNADSTKPWTTDYSPNLVTICLGTNDNSAGDGSYDRMPIDSATFVNAYIRFVKHLRTRYPNATICLINGPVFGGVDRDKFRGFLEATVIAVKDTTGDEKLFSFTYQNVYGKGCTGHPSMEEHELMAEELRPFLKKIMHW
jgi:lysophospholipase L1-like esterase